ncbi:MAG: ACP S-malonyltransferase, partial [Lachnospiraceae bacterium]|nr:ACP S-malonyltransferase [Lachnospiraceae bacterium]
MSKMVFMFPGQGAQYAGMGKDFYEKEKAAKEIFEKAGYITGLDIPAICFEENDKLSVTEYTQIAMVTVEIAILKVLEERGIRPQAAAGLSLGEYGAIVASGVMRADTALAIVRRRGVYMQEAVPTGGAMAAVLGLSTEVIEEICEHTEGIVSIANYNCPGQIVITGEAAAVQKAGEALQQKGAKRVVPLNVSGPFHSQMLVGAGERLRKDLDRAQLLDFS